MRLNYILICLSICSIVADVRSQPGIEFIRTYDNGRKEAFNDIYLVSDGGLITCGISTMEIISPYGGTGGSSFVVRTDEDGREIWSRTYNNNDPTVAYSIIELDGGDFVFGGKRGNQFTATRINPEGEVDWWIDYGVGTCNALIELKSGDLVLCGSGGGGRVILVHPNGELVWLRTHPERAFYALRETEDGVVLAGQSRANDVWVAKVELNQGNLIWSRTHDLGRDASWAYSMCSSNEGGFVLTGFAITPSDDLFLLKVNAQGQQAWRNIIVVNNNYEKGISVARLLDGFVTVGASHAERGNILDHPIVVRTNQVGQVRWRSEYTWDGDEQFMTPSAFTSVVRAPDQSIYVAGYLVNRRDTLHDALIMKIEPDIIQNQNIVISPEDTNFTILSGIQIDFSVSVEEGPWEEILTYNWIHLDTLISQDTTTTILFDSTGVFLVSCILRQDELTIAIRWHVTVSDLFIARHTPDTLDLMLRRGASQTFTIDSVAAIQGDDPIQYLWTLADLTNQQSEEIGEDSSVTVDFVRSGNYAVIGEAYRGDASDAVTWRVAVRGAVLDFVPPSLDLTVRTDTTLHFEVFAFNPVSDSLSYSWYFGEDLIGLDSAADVIFGSEEGLFQVSAVVMDGAEGDTVVWRVRTVTSDGIEDCRFKIADWGIKEVWPNPFNSELTISIHLYGSSSSSTSALTLLTIHDITGREVAEIDGKWKMENGTRHSVTWDASVFPAGIYLVRLQSGSNVGVKKVVLMR